MNRGNKGNRGRRGPLGGNRRAFGSRSNRVIQRATVLANEYDLQVVVIIRNDHEDPPIEREYGFPNVEDVVQRCVDQVADHVVLMETARQGYLPNAHEYSNEDLTNIAERAENIMDKTEVESARSNNGQQ